MSFVNFRNAINTKLKTISKIKSVYVNPTKDFQGFPAAVIVPADQTGIYETVNENERAYGFTIFLVLNLKGRTLTNAYEAMYDLVDTVINAFDNDPYLSNIDGAGTNVTLDAEYTIIGVEPAPSVWGQDDELQQLIASVNLKCRCLFEA